MKSTYQKKIEQRNDTSKTRTKRIRKGDVVCVIAGDHAKDSGSVLSIDPTKGTLMIEGVNIRKLTLKNRSRENTRGGFIERECPIPISNVMKKEIYDQRRAGGKS